MWYGLPFFWFEMCFAPQLRALFQQLNFQKYSRIVCFYHFDLQICFAPRSFALWTASKSDPTMRCFVRFGFGMYFRAPQSHALFRHHNVQKRFETWGVLCILISKIASRHSGGQFLISLIRPDGSAPAAFASVLFDPAEPQIQSIGKYSLSRLFYLFSCLDLLSILTLSLLALCLLRLLTVAASVHKSEVWLLNSLRRCCIYIYIHMYIQTFD